MIVRIDEPDHPDLDISQYLKVGNKVKVQFDNYWNTGSNELVTIELKIISELKKIVYLEDGKSLAKPNGRPYNFCGTLIEIIVPQKQTIYHPHNFEKRTEV